MTTELLLFILAVCLIPLMIKIAGKMVRLAAKGIVYLLTGCALLMVAYYLFAMFSSCMAVAV